MTSDFHQHDQAGYPEDGRRERAMRRRDFGQGPPVPSGRNRRRSAVGARPGWAQALESSLEQSGMLVLVNNSSSADSARRDVDEQLARIAALMARVTADMASGREVRVLQQDIGLPPSTFSRAGEVRSGGMMTLVSSWYEEGMPTLLGLPVMPPPLEERGRSAILIAEGPPALAETFEDHFRDTFDPAHYTKSIGPDTGDGMLRYVVLWAITPEEVAAALGIDQDDPHLQRILDSLEHHALMMRSRESRQDLTKPTIFGL